jgi:hypothetical protein
MLKVTMHGDFRFDVRLAPERIEPMDTFFAFLILGLAAAVAFYFRPIRKTIGLLMVILGGILCLTFVGAIVGIPAIILGGLLLFL